MLDFPRFLKLFPLTSIPKSDWRGELVTTPERLALTEQIRAIAGLTDMASKVPCDIFIFGLGEPPDRRLTKVGGLPFRPASRPWPTSAIGQPMSFVGQFNFCCSRDITRSVPGDVLLVFSENDDICSDDPMGKLQFEWSVAEMSEDACCRPADVPDTQWTIRPCYGVRHRTSDYSGKVVMQALASVLDSKQSTYGIESATIFLDRLWGTKIGGLPITGRGDLGLAPNPWGGSFLCSLGTVGHCVNRPFPWVNHEAPIPLDDWTALDGCLDIRDGFVLEFYLQDNGSIRWWIQFC